MSFFRFNRHVYRNFSLDLLPKLELSKTDSLENHVGAVLSIFWFASGRNWDEFNNLIALEVNSMVETNLKYMNAVINKSNELNDAK